MSNYIQQLHSYSISHKNAKVDIRENFSITQNQAELIYEKKYTFYIKIPYIFLRALAPCGPWALSPGWARACYTYMLRKY